MKKISLKFLLAIFIASTFSSCTGVSYGYFNRHEVKFSEKPKVSLVVFAPSNFDLAITNKSREPKGFFKEEIVPKNQSFDDWQEKITILINQNSSLNADQFFDSLSQESQKKCGDNFSSFNDKWREDGSDVVGSILCGNGEQDFLRIFNSQYGLILISYTTKAKPYDAKVYTPISVTDGIRLRNSFGFAFICEGGLGSCDTPNHNAESLSVPRQRLKFSTLNMSGNKLLITNSKIGKTKIQDIQLEGNLQKSHNLPCIGINEAKNTYTPADLYASSAKCIAQNDNKSAIELYVLASSYAKYDMMRISDKTVSGAATVMIMNSYGSVETQKKEKFSKDAREFNNSPAAKALCDKIKKIGKPNYYPRYMVLHGLEAMRNTMESKLQNDGLKKNYDAEKNWLETMKGYSGCRK